MESTDRPYIILCVATTVVASEYHWSKTLSDTMTTLMRGLAEALAPYLPGSSEDVDVDDAVQNYVDENFDFESMVADTVSEIDFDDVISDNGVMTYGNFDPDDHGCLTNDSFDASDWDLVSADDVRDIVTEELQATGAVVTIDNILSTLAAALTAAAEARAA